MDVIRFWYIIYVLVMSRCQKGQAGHYYYRSSYYNNTYDNDLYYYDNYDYDSWEGWVYGASLGGIIFVSIGILGLACALCDIASSRKSTRVMHASTVSGSNIMTTQFDQPYGHDHISQDTPPYSSRLSHPPSYSSRRSHPPSYSSRRSHPPSYSSRRSSPPSYSSRLSSPPSYCSRISPPPSYSSRISPPPSYRSCPDHPPVYLSQPHAHNSNQDPVDMRRPIRAPIGIFRLMSIAYGNDRTCSD